MIDNNLFRLFGFSLDSNRNICIKIDEDYVNIDTLPPLDKIFEMSYDIEIPIGEYSEKVCQSILNLIGPSKLLVGTDETIAIFSYSFYEDAAKTAKEIDKLGCKTVIIPN